MWELRAECTTPFLWFINLGAALMGLAVAPRRTVRAFRAGRGRTTLYRLSLSEAEVMRMSVGELRRRLSIPEVGLIDQSVRGSGNTSGARARKSSRMR
jgi:hypothetical protein